MEEFAKRLKEARKLKGETQREVTKNAGVAQATIACYESEAREPKVIDIIRKLAIHYNVSTDWLLGLTDDPERKK